MKIRKGLVAASSLTVMVALVATGAMLASRDDAEARPRRAAVAASAAEATSPTAVEEVEFWQDRVDRDPDDFVSRTQLASALVARARQTHATADAILADSEIDRVLAARPEDRSALLVKAQARMFVHDFAAGRSYAERVLAVDPSDKGALTLAGDAAFELGDLDVAAATFETLAARIGESPELLARRARLAAAGGETALAIAFAEQAVSSAEALTLAPELSTYYDLLLGDLLHRSGRYEEAAASFEQMLAVNDEDGAAIENLARVRAALGDLEASERLWKRSGELIGAPDFHVLAALGDLAHARGHDERARDLWQAALDAVAALPREERVGFLRDESRFRASHGLDPAAALRLAEQDLGIRHDALAYDTLAWAQFANGNSDAARVSIEHALGTGIQDAGVWYHAAEIFAATGDRAGARDAITRALDMNPAFDLYESADARRLAAQLH